MERWKEYKLDDVCISIADGDHMPPPKVNGGIPFVTTWSVTIFLGILSYFREVFCAFYRISD